MTHQRNQLSQKKAQLDKKLSNEQFVSKAPDAVVAKVTNEAKDLASELQSINQQLARLI